MRSRIGALLALPAVLAAAGLARAGEPAGVCSSAPALAGPGNYSAVFSGAPAGGGIFDELSTRSVSRRDHALVDGATRAWTTSSGWDKARLSFLMQPNKGANFVMFLADMAAGSTAAPKTPITERFMLVLQGQLEIDVNGEPVEVGSNHYAYLPPASEEYLSQTVTSKGGAKMLVFERIFAKAEGMPIFRHGGVDDVAPAAAAGGPAGASTQRHLVPDSDEWDFDVLVVDVKPGFSAAAVKAHHHNHGMLLLSGEGIFRLGDNWYLTRAGDAVWAAPYVPQWFAALGTEPARLVIYRDRNVDPLFVS